MWIILILGLFSCLVFYYLQKQKSALDLIPGPSKYRNYFDMIKYGSVTELMKHYKKKYGDIYRFHLMGNIVITNPQSVNLTLQSNYRGDNMSELFSTISDCNGLFMKNGQIWKDFRAKMIVGDEAMRLIFDKDGVGSAPNPIINN